MRRIFYLNAAHPLSTFKFGYPVKRGTFNSYILTKAPGSYGVYVPFIWNHLCYAYKKPGDSRMVLVRLF